MPPPSDVVVVLALAGMLAVAFVHPSGRVEALVGLTCACATVATGLLTSAEVRAAVTDLAPVVAFLVTILVAGARAADDDPRPTAPPPPTPCVLGPAVGGARLLDPRSMISTS